MVYQNRDTNTLFYSKSDQSGNFQAPSVIASTGAIDEPGFWDNSGFADVTVAHYGTVLYVVCTDDIAQKVILLRKNDDSSEWIRHEVSEVIDAHFWAYPKFAISSTGVLGIAYRNNEGTIFSYAQNVTPEQWHSVLVTSDTPNSSQNIKTVFSTATDAHVYVKYGGSFGISTTDNAVTNESYPIEPPSGLSPEEIQSVASTTRNETQSNHIRLQNGRLVIALTNARRVIVAVEDH